MDTRKFVASAAATVVVAVGVLFAVFSQTRPAIESVPLDWGWTGFLFIFANGFLFSCIIVNKKIGVLDRLLLTIGLGFGLTFIVMILLGVLWQITLLSVLLTQVPLLVVIAAFAVRRGLSLPRYTLQQNLEIKKRNILQALLIAIIGVLAFAALYNTLSLPPTEWDSLAYGVNYARIIYQNSGIPLIAGPSIGIEMSAPYPPGMQLSATFIYTFAGNANDFYYRMLAPIFSVATLLLVYKFTRQITKNRTASVFAVSALTLIPFFWELFIKESYLMALTFMLTMSAYFFYKAYAYKTVEPRNYEVLGSLFCGFAALTSYIGLLAFGVPLLYTVHRRIGLKRFAWLIGLSVLVVFPWYLRNLVLLGNPFFPFGGGNYLDPLLHSSTSLSFQQYLQIPEYALTSTLCKVAAFLLVAGIVFFTLSKKRRDFPLTLTLYFLLVGLSLMAVYVAFPRYLLISLPTSAVFFGFAINSVPKRRIFSAELPQWSSRLRRIKSKLLATTQSQIVSAIFIVLVVLGSAVIFPYVDSVKPSATGESRINYIASVYPEGNAWKWISENTSPNTKIATFDIKEYYLNRTLFSLDGNEAVPLYYMDNITDALTFLNDNGVGYVLSVPWASPMDPRMPQAYKECIITRYLCDSNYFPLVFFDPVYGTAIYHVGPVGNDTLNAIFATQGLVYPDRKFSFDVAITNSYSNNLPMGEFYIPIPVDYLELNITASVQSKNSSQPLEIHLWTGKTTTWITTKENYMIAHSEYGLGGNVTTSFNRYIDLVGYFTIRVVDKEPIENFTNLTVTVNVAFI